MKTPRISTFFYIVGGLFLFNDTLKALDAHAYWDVFKNAVFYLVIVYMIFIYPKRKLHLNEDMMSILFIYFFALSIKALLILDYLQLGVGILYTVGFVAYKLYRRKHKYSFYLKR